MDPVTAFLAVWITGFVVREVGGDLWADVKGRERPSQIQARQRHERKLARGERPNPSSGYLNRLVENGAETLAKRSDQKHDAKLAWLDEQKDHRAQKWLNRKRKRAAFTERVGQAAAAKAGLAWGKTRDAADKIREQHKERQAWRRNATEPDPADAAPDAGEAENGWCLPIEYDDDGNAWARHPDGTYSRYEEPTREQQDYVDEQVPNAQVLEFSRPDRSPEPTEQPDPDPSNPDQVDSEPSDPDQVDSEPSDPDQGDTVSSNNNQNSNPAGPAPTATAAEPSFETAGLTATLSRTQASADNCTALVAEWDQRKATLESESEALTQQIAGIETQIAALQQAGNVGDEIAQLRAAQEQYTSVLGLLDEQTENASVVLEAYQAAAAAFGQAHSGFQQQVAGQDFYAAHQGAGNKEFLTQG